MEMEALLTDHQRWRDCPRHSLRDQLRPNPRKAQGRTGKGEGHHLQSIELAMLEITYCDTVPAVNSICAFYAFFCMPGTFTKM